MVGASLRRNGGLLRAPCWRDVISGFLALLALIAPATAEPIRGAGSTFAAPVLAQWARIYKNARADGGDFFTLDWTVDYEPVGSLGGLMRLDQPEMDFAATDAPVDAARLTASGRQQFPIVMGALAVVVNLDGVESGTLRLTGPLIADIYLGNVRSWSDPAIKALNPGMVLPDAEILPLHRQDGSGSTFVFTDYLAAVSPEWKTKLGADTLIVWPVGEGFEGTRALIDAVAATSGAIAYAEFGQADRAGLASALVRNKAGNFVRPEPASVEAAAASVAWEKAAHFDVSLADQPGPAAYPIATATFAVLAVAGRSADRYERVHDLFRLAFEQGDDEARALSFVPLPEGLVARVKRYWDGDARAGN